jgi:hypothetical protein
VHIQSLNTVWKITKFAYKPFLCGIVVHPTTDGCIQLHENFQAKGESISSGAVGLLPSKTEPVQYEDEVVLSDKVSRSRKQITSHVGRYGDLPATSHLPLGKMAEAVYV